MRPVSTLTLLVAALLLVTVRAQISCSGSGGICSTAPCAGTTIANTDCGAGEACCQGATCTAAVSCVNPDPCTIETFTPFTQFDPITNEPTCTCLASNWPTDPCDDGFPCTTDSGQNVNGQCVCTNTPDNVPCDDNNACTANDRIRVRDIFGALQCACAGDLLDLGCDDNDPCTSDVQEEENGQCICRNLETVPCQPDGDACTQEDVVLVNNQCTCVQEYVGPVCGPNPNPCLFRDFGPIDNNGQCECVPTLYIGAEKPCTDSLGAILPAENPCDVVVPTVAGTQCVCEEVTNPALLSSCDDSRTSTLDVLYVPVGARDTCACANVPVAQCDNDQCTPRQFVIDQVTGEFVCVDGPAVVCGANQYCVDGACFATATPVEQPVTVEIFGAGTRTSDNAEKVEYTDGTTGAKASGDGSMSTTWDIRADNDPILVPEGTALGVDVIISSNTDLVITSGTFDSLDPTTDSQLIGVTGLSDTLNDLYEDGGDLFNISLGVVVEFGTISETGLWTPIETTTVASEVPVECVPQGDRDNIPISFAVFNLDSCAFGRELDPETCTCVAVSGKRQILPEGDVFVRPLGLVFISDRGIPLLYNVSTSYFRPSPREAGCTVGYGFVRNNNGFLELPGSPYPYELFGETAEESLKKKCKGDAACHCNRFRIAACANFQDGTASAPPEIIDAATLATDKLLALAPGQTVRNGDEDYGLFLELAMLFERYLEGEIGPGKCSNEEEALLKIDQEALDELLSLYENQQAMNVIVNNTQGMTIAVLVFSIIAAVAGVAALVVVLAWCLRPTANRYSPLGARSVAARKYF